VTHTIHDKTKLFHRIRRIRGQVDAIERALSEEAECADTLRLIAAARGAMNALMAELMEDHIRFHVLDPEHGAPSAPALTAAQELIDVINAYLK
jgi:DNA-binding FrmR family transcriptional regulator